jgi:sialidase-1
MVGAAFAALCLRAAAAPGPVAEILETKIICNESGRFLGAGTAYRPDANGHAQVRDRAMEPDRYLGWGTIVKTRTGELIVVFSGDRDAHVCPWGKTQMIRSGDEGRTWSEPRTITNSPLDDRDAGIIETKAGTLVVSWFTSLAFANSAYGPAMQLYARHAEKIPQETRDRWLGNWVRRSEDGGKTWLAPVRTVATAPHGPITLRDGRLLYIGNAHGLDHSQLAIEQSPDDGRSWRVIARIEIPQGPMGGLGEPHLVELRSGKILALFRHEPPKGTGDKTLLQSESLDGGHTWSPLHGTGIWGLPPHLMQLANGDVLVVYGYRRAPFGERACVSRDEGKTWDVDHVVTLASAPNGDLGYPSSVQLKDGSILTVYYQEAKAGENTCFMSTHWRLKDH